ncbi:MAG TPA: CHAT domain-containing protein [Vicinamibacteria bacterium]|nr:CHAT domain-containing protein [Vicinamibacteria bacterium]
MTRGYAQCLAAERAEQRSQAAADLAAADRLARQLAAAELVADVLLRSGTCASLGRDYPVADRLFREALAIARTEKRPFLEAMAAGSLGNLCLRNGRYDEGADWLKKALELASALKAENITLKTLVNLGWCHYKLGDFERALDFLRRADSLALARGYTGDRLAGLTVTGNAYYRLGDLTKAVQVYDSALPIARTLGDRGETSTLLANLGILALERGRYDEAESHVREALSMASEIGDALGTLRSMLTQGEILFARGHRSEAEAIYRQVIDAPLDDPELHWEARAALAHLLAGARRPLEAETEFRKAFAIMEQSRSELRKAEDKISFFSGVKHFYEGYVDLLVQAGLPWQALQVADEGRARLMRERLGTDNSVLRIEGERLRELAQTLDAVLLCYSTASKRSFLWLVTPNRQDFHVLPDEEILREHVASHQQRIRSSRDLVVEAAPEAQWLYHALFGPVQPLIPRGSRVIVIPDGPLHSLSFETLVRPDPKPHYLIEDVTLGVAPSLGLLAAGATPSRRRVGRRAVLIIGNPLAPDEEFPPLAWADREVRGIADQFDPLERVVYSGAQANPFVYRNADPGHFSLIHFAAHAKANPDIPLDSAVILSRKDDAYKLYGREIMEIPLRAELVTLSACRSAGSRIYRGEGLVGLAWAFLSAGARSVIAGLWNVEDASTSELMVDLYRGIRKGESPAEALREAKLCLLRSDGAYRKPFYWAPFVLYTRSPERSPEVSRVP